MSVTPDAYATVAYFRLNAPSAQAFTNTSDDVVQSALNRRSRFMDGYLIRKFKLPLLDWQDDLRGAVTDMAAYDCLIVRGYNPEGADAAVRMRFEDAFTWAKSIPLNTTPMVIDSSGSITPGVNDLSPTVTSAEQRGFSSRPVQPGCGAPRISGDYIGD